MLSKSNKCRLHKKITKKGAKCHIVDWKSKSWSWWGKNKWVHSGKMDKINKDKIKTLWWVEKSEKYKMNKVPNFDTIVQPPMKGGIKKLNYKFPPFTTIYRLTRTQPYDIWGRSKLKFIKNYFLFNHTTSCSHCTLSLLLYNMNPTSNLHCTISSLTSNCYLT